MTKEQFQKMIESIELSADKDGWICAPGERLLTLYAACDGVSLTVSKVDKMHHEGGVVRATTGKGEQYALALDDLFAFALDAPVSSARKAGFGSV